MNLSNPAVTAGAINANPEFLRRILSTDADPGRPGSQPGISTSVIAGAVNANPGFLAGMIGHLSPEASARSMEVDEFEGDSFTTRLMKSDESIAPVVAGVLNENPDFLIGLVRSLDYRTIASVLNSVESQGFMKEYVGNGDMSAVSDVINDQGVADSIAELVSHLDVPVVAAAMNQNETAIKATLDNLANDTSLASIAKLLAEPEINSFARELTSCMEGSSTADALAGDPEHSLGSGNFIGDLLTAIEGKGGDSDEFARAIANVFNDENSVIRNIRFKGMTQLADIMGGEIGWLPDFALNPGAALPGWSEYRGAEVCDRAGLPNGTPFIVSVEPNSGNRRVTNLNVTIIGKDTNFKDGVSIADFGLGITVNSLKVNPTISTEAIANIDIAEDAPLGLRDVKVTTGKETAIGWNLFEVK